MLLCGVMMVGALSACGSKSNEATGETSDAKETTEATTASGDVKISFFDSKAYGTEEYDKILAEYAAKEGIEIEIQHTPNDYDTLLMSRFNSNEIPDVMAVQVGSAAQQYYEYAYDWTDDTDILATFNDDAIDTGRDEEGRVKSLPSTYETMGMLYNKDVFAKAGIEEIPTTLSELREVCEKLEAAGITPFAIAGKEQWVLHQLGSNFMMDKSLDAKGVVDGLNDGSLTFETLPNYKNLFTLLDLIIEFGSDKQLEYDWETSENMLANGEVGMIQMGDWCQSIMDEFNPDANLGFIPCPVSENPEDATLLSSISWTYIVNKDSENLEAAKAAAVYMLNSDEILKWTTDVIANVPAAKGEFQVDADLANDAASYIEAGKTNGWIHSLAPTGFQDKAGATFQSYMLGQITADEAIEAIQGYWNE